MLPALSHGRLLPCEIDPKVDVAVNWSEASKKYKAGLKKYLADYPSASREELRAAVPDYEVFVPERELLRDERLRDLKRLKDEWVIKKGAPYYVARDKCRDFSLHDCRLHSSECSPVFVSVSGESVCTINPEVQVAKDYLAAEKLSGRRAYLQEKIWRL